MRKKKVKKENSERWLLTYSDLITLLMIFFVVMYSMSNVDASKYSQVSDSLRYTFSGSQYVLGEGGSGGGTGSNGDGLTTRQGATRLSRTEELEGTLEKYLKDNALENEVYVDIEPRGLVVSLKDSVFFESGKASVAAKYAQNILEIGKILDTLKSDIVIEGYTDNVPIHNSIYPSNWELAAMRAINVVHLLVEEGHLSPSMLSATSYGEYRPSASNETAEGKAQNRRISIVVLSSEFYKSSIKE